MLWFSKDSGKVAATTRGRVVQRILVDGLSPAQAAAAFGIGERQVVRWVAAYRRRGMASLRDDGATDSWRQLWSRRWRGVLRRVANPATGAELAPFVASRRRRR